MNSCIQGTHPSLKENTNAKATVTAIIDGTGSLGAAVGPLLVGLITHYSVSRHHFIKWLAFQCLSTFSSLSFSRLGIMHSTY